MYPSVLSQVHSYIPYGGMLERYLKRGEVDAATSGGLLFHERSVNIGYNGGMTRQKTIEVLAGMGTKSAQNSRGTA